MSKMEILKAFLNERLIAAAEEIFGAFEKTIAEYRDEISRAKDLEISRLRIQLKLLKSERCPEVQEPQQQPTLHHHHHQSIPAVTAADTPEQQHCDQEEENSSMEPLPETSQVKREKSQNDFWICHEEEQLDELESDIKEFIASPPNVKNNLQDSPLPFHPYHNNSEENREKPYCCSVCEKRFSNCSHLAAHIRTHTGERPYRCEICRKTFITTSALNRHQTIHTEGKQFICNYCGKCFKWMESLGRHMRCIHKRENVPVEHVN